MLLNKIMLLNKKYSILYSLVKLKIENLYKKSKIQTLKPGLNFLHISKFVIKTRLKCSFKKFEFTMTKIIIFSFREKG